MKRKCGQFLAGLLCGAVVFGGVNAYAAVLAERSSHKVTVDGVPVAVEAYNINGSNYFQLRDLAKLLDVGIEWNSATRTVEISTEGGYTEDDLPNQTAPKPSTETTSEDLYDIRVEIVELTNDLRRQNSVAALTMDDDLMEAAQVRADEIAATLAYRHERPDGSKMRTVLQHTGSLYYGENLGAKDYRGLADAAELADIQVNSWNDSDGHRANMLSTNYSAMGVGIAQDRYGMYFLVQVFAGGDYTITGVDDPIIP